jgi:RHS repeat-associated protein
VIYGKQSEFVINEVIAMRTANYYANTVNQYTNRQVSTAIDVVGNANTKSTVNVTINGNSQSVYTNYGYFQAVGNIGNDGGAVWKPLVVTATKGGKSVQQTGYVLVPAASQTFTYDFDGNLTGDTVWGYTWDAENRLINMDCLVAGPTNQHLVFEYDWRGRRIHKVVKDTSNAIIAETKYLYDGWNLVAELNGANQLVRSYLWGLDLSGTMEGAGGVGGLLAVNYYGTQTTNCFVAYDGNGNVTALINATNGLVCARYEYGPFGELIRATGPMAKLNPFRFSTKYQDDETDLVYYGRRYLNTSTGRWLSRDPIEEKGGLNLYGLCNNDSQNRFDILGMYDNCCCDPQRVSDGEASLTSHYKQADVYLQGQGVPRGGDDDYSCYEINSKILSFITRAPKCWTCTLERRQRTVVGYFLRDHWVVICSSHPKSGPPKEILFDYWKGRTPGEDPNGWFRSTYPQLLEKRESSRYALCSEPYVWRPNYRWLDIIPPKK